MYNLSLKKREFDLIVDALIHRSEDLTDIAVFSVSPLSIKLRVNETDKLVNSLRALREEKHEK